MRSVETLELGVLIERRESVSSWQRWVWRPSGVMAWPGPDEPWRILRDDGRVAIFYAGRLPLRLYPDEAGAYLENLGRGSPDLYVVMRSGGGAQAEPPVRPVLLTASPDEAAAYSEGQEGVYSVQMPPAVAARVHRFAMAHRRPEPFVRRNRREREAREAKAEAPKGGMARRRPAWQSPGAS